MELKSVSARELDKKTPVLIVPFMELKIYHFSLTLMLVFVLIVPFMELKNI